jgi:putative nucleotidyltransferase with HDIG domain
MSAIYRVRQFVRAVGAWVRSDSCDQVGQYLPDEAIGLFQAMPRYDRQHALRVFRLLQDEGHTDPDLLVAALLHDAGKTARRNGSVRLWHRVGVVLSNVFWPGLLARLAKDQVGSWRQPLYVQLHHAAIGAELARGAGCSQRTVDLIRLHEDPAFQAEDPLLQVLQSADSRS